MPHTQPPTLSSLLHSLFPNASLQTSTPIPGYNTHFSAWSASPLSPNPHLCSIISSSHSHLLAHTPLGPLFCWQNPRSLEWHGRLCGTLVPPESFLHYAKELIHARHH